MVEFEHVSKSFGRVTALDGLTFKAELGELLVLVGPSGCGKTTALRLVAGLETTTDGRLLIDGQDVASVRPNERNCAMVFQSYALYPHLSVAENIGFGLKARRVPRVEREQRVRDVATRLGLGEHLDRLPRQLSGGQRQRVALGRAIVRQPKVFLFDEPLSNLDASLREQTRSDIVDMQKRTGITSLYVTHDQTEAMTMGDRVLVLDKGRAQAFDTPQRLYRDPPNLFTAEFLGRPRINVFRVAIESQFEDMVLMPMGWKVANLRIPDKYSGSFTLGVRPEDVHFVQSDNDGGMRWRIVRHEFLGARVIWTLASDIGSLRVVTDSDRLQDGVAQGASVVIQPRIAKLLLFDPQTGNRIRFN